MMHCLGTEFNTNTIASFTLAAVDRKVVSAAQCICADGAMDFCARRASVRMC